MNTQTADRAAEEFELDPYDPAHLADWHIRASTLRDGDAWTTRCNCCWASFPHATPEDSIAEFAQHADHRADGAEPGWRAITWDKRIYRVGVVAHKYVTDCGRGRVTVTCGQPASSPTAHPWELERVEASIGGVPSCSRFPQVRDAKEYVARMLAADAVCAASPDAHR